MIPLSSKLESREQEFVEIMKMLEEHQFSLGGNWDYHQGSFDRYLDEAHKVWLRIPFDVINGNLDDQTEENDAKIRLGQPYVLKHVYNEGLDPEAQVQTLGALVNQFQTPVDPDAPIEQHWLDEAKDKLAQVERLFPN
ncbi:YugN family protein [Paenibacillus pinihumi]|uniref:YugN family protein n=1 Tax=Paenibacillus pinihumi TaxID=669462 RepID=UPI0003F7D878|nr:YugN family protein [Paenibacillus pinihumi]